MKDAFKQPLIAGGAIVAAGVILFGLSRLSSSTIALVPAIDPATATPDQSTIPDGGAQSDYWNYNQALFTASAFNLANPNANANATNAPTGSGFDLGALQASLLSSLSDLLSGASSTPSTVADLTNQWLNNAASSTPSNTGAPASTGAGGTSSPSDPAQTYAPAVAPVTQIPTYLPTSSSGPSPIARAQNVLSAKGVSLGLGDASSLN